MELFSIFADHLWSIRYDEEKEDEYNRLFHLWVDMNYVESYIEQHIDKLDTPFWQEHGAYDTAASAAMKVYDEATELKEWFLQLNANLTAGKKPDFDSHFKQLSKQDLNEQDQSKFKAYGLDTPSMLRLYAIKMENNAYVITGGGIKLTRKMNEDALLMQELRKMNHVERWLTKNGIL